MNIKIAILGYRDFIDLTKGILKNNDHRASIDVYQCFLDQCLPIIPHLEQNQTDIIITGRANQVFLRSKTQIPIITFRITPIDLLSAIKKSLHYSNTIAIALANFEDLEYDYSILQELLNINLTFISYNTEDELRQKMHWFSSKKGVVIGTSMAINIAKSFELPGILIYSLENSITESIERAIEIIQFKELEEKNNKQFKAILDSVREGIIVTDDKDEITLINNSSRDLLHNSNTKLSGTTLKNLFREGASANLRKQNDFHDRIIEIGNKTMNVNLVSIYVRGKKAGNVVTLQDMTQIQKIEQKYRLETEAKGMVAKINFGDIVCSDNSMRKLIEKAIKYSQTESTVLIMGETGTGKELFAQSIHNHSRRRNFPFVAINCAALPENLLESELFGYQDGAFTGASKKGKKGLFEIAHSGTIFLDEINSVSPHFQARLLRVLQEKEVIRIGSDKVIPIDVRVIAASNADLLSLVNENKFRADLYYRLNVLKISLPPLRKRLDDLLPLTKNFIYNQNKNLYVKLENNLPDICKELSRYKFFGNVRELYNILERFMILCDIETNLNINQIKSLLKESIDDQQTENAQKKVSFPIKENYKESIFEAEKSLFLTYLEISNGDKASLADKLGISKTTLYRKLKEMNIDY